MRRLAFRGRRRGFNLLEVIIAVIFLGAGLIVVLQMFPKGAQASRTVQDNSRVTLLAQTIIEALKADPSGQLLWELRMDPNNPAGPRFLGVPEAYIGYSNSSLMTNIPLPGNGLDDDAPVGLKQFYETTPGPADQDFNRDGWKDVNWDGLPEQDYAFSFVYMGNTGFNITPNLLDDDRDGVPDDNGDYNDDGDLSYDPEPPVDEEWPDGIDNDQDGLVDEDLMLASVRMRVAPQNATYEMIARRSLLPGDGHDQDGDGEIAYDGAGNPIVDRWGYAIADGRDNNGDGRIDEGIDEEVWNGRDDDGDGKVDEDTRMSSFPYNPVPFSPVLQAGGVWQVDRSYPTSSYSWRIFVGRVYAGGDNFNNDNDRDYAGGAAVDEELYDNLDDDNDGLVDEDVIAYPMPGYRLVRIEITWGGDRLDNDGDIWIDEEAPDGIDNDLDGLTDEDIHERVFTLTGILPLGVRTRR